MSIEIRPRIDRTVATGSPEISDETHIVRYVKLSTFLLLLAGRVFVPTLRNLQGQEELEGRIPTRVWKNYAENLFIDLDCFERWLLDQETESPSLPEDIRRWIATIKKEAPPANEKDFDKFGLLAEIWLHELSIRRCVWCWNDCSGGPSEAMWNRSRECSI